TNLGEALVSLGSIALDSSENIYIGGSIKNYSMSENDM
ncbi:unnamed protein product, partial [marine sediment metagenome]